MSFDSDNRKCAQHRQRDGDEIVSWCAGTKGIFWCCGCGLPSNTDLVKNERWCYSSARRLTCRRLLSKLRATKFARPTPQLLRRTCHICIFSKVSTEVKVTSTAVAIHLQPYLSSYKEVVCLLVGCKEPPRWEN